MRRLLFHGIIWVGKSEARVRLLSPFKAKHSRDCKAAKVGRWEQSKCVLLSIKRVKRLCLLSIRQIYFLGKSINALQGIINQIGDPVHPLTLYFRKKTVLMHSNQKHIKPPLYLQRLSQRPSTPEDREVHSGKQWTLSECTFLVTKTNAFLMVFMGDYY